MHPIKILRIIDRLNIGGPAIHVLLVSKYMDRMNTANPWTTVIASGKEGENEGHISALGMSCDAAIADIPSLGRELHLIKDLSTLWRLIRLIRKEKPTIVHTHKAKAGALGRLAARLCGVPVVVHTFHGHVLHGYFGKWKSRFFIWIERRMAKLSDKIIAVSEQVKEDLLQYKIAPAEKIEVVPLGLELDKFAQKGRNCGGLRNELGLPANCPLVGIVARLVPIKGIPTFLAAAKHVLETLPGTHFIIAGDGELREELENKARDWGLSQNVHFLGFRPDTENIYSDLDVLVLTSYNEGSPVCLIEGLAAGCAVAALNAGGVGDVVRHGETGLLVSRTTEEETARNLAGAICKLLQNPSQRSRMGQAGQKDVLARFSIQRLASDLDRLYRQILAQKGLKDIK